MISVLLSTLLVVTNIKKKNIIISSQCLADTSTRFLSASTNLDAAIPKCSHVRVALPLRKKKTFCNVLSINDCTIIQ